MTFSKEKMVARVTADGKADLLTPEVMEIMDNLDGQEATASCWERQVYGRPVYWVQGKDGVGQYVYEEDVI